MPLSREQITHYRRHGYVLLERLFDGDSLARWSERFEAIAREEVPRPDDLTVMKEVMVVRGVTTPQTPVHAVNKILSFENDPILWAYALDPRLLEPVRSIAGPELRTISSNVFNKPPGVDSRFPLHQDLRYFRLRPADKIVASWTAISPTTRENGCLAVVPGSHLGELREHEDPDWEYVNRGYFAAEGAEIGDRRHIEMSPGDTLLFHPLLLHGSGSNRSDGFRRAISVHFASTDCVRPDGPSKHKSIIRDIPGA